jgi:EAL domain-containing protein (putative c-di-GMP-specific phosphodiesterase class I)
MVNVSARHLRDGELATDVVALFAEHPALAGRLTVELTETEFAEDTAEAADTLQALVALGIGVAIDDFGTGYSSLTYLPSLPATAVKVDQRFVQAAGADAGATAIVKAVADLGATFGREVVAEGIETLEQAEVVRRLGVPLGQGYQIARPMPLAEFDAWLDAWLADDPAGPDLAVR